MVAHSRHGRLPAARGLVPRRPLFDRLSRVGPGEVVLLCAPAGSGKTALLRSWVESEGLADRVAWVSVERAERDAQRFWLSVVDELAGAVAEDGLVERVGATPAFGGQAVVERLLSDLGSLGQPVVLVVDDLHELRSVEALRLLERFLAGLPPALRVVLATREDVGLGLHRLRLAGALTEIRGPDLRFSQEETRQLLDASGLTLSDSGSAQLWERTEGWAAGLRLAAISLAGHPDPERFVAEFSGSERTVAGYLLAEVLERQPPDVRDLLLRTSVLERVNGPLADTLTGRMGSEAILQGLEDANAFVVSLDAGRSWFRYHHLLTDLLQLELRRVSPAIIDSLHRAAATWFEEHGFEVEAIRHAQSAGDWGQAARVLADNSVDLVFDGRKATLRALLAAFPAGAPEKDAELALAFATGRLYDGLLEESGTHIAAAERLAATVPDARRRLFDLRLASARLWLACQRGDLATARQAMGSFDAQTEDELARSNDHRASALMNLGIAELWSLQLDEARRDLEGALALARRIGRPYLEVGCLGHLALAAVLGSRAERRAGAERGGGDDRGGPRMGNTSHPRARGRGGGRRAGVARSLRRCRAVARAGRAPRRRRSSRRSLSSSSRGPSCGSGRAGSRRRWLSSAPRTGCMPRSSAGHALPIDVRGWIVLVQALKGDRAAARAALATIGADERDSAGMRLAAAALRAGGRQPAGGGRRAGAADRRHAKALHPRWATVHALLFDAAARDRLGDRAGAEASIERALELAEPEGVVLQFALAPVRELLERHPRHRTTHATLLATILGMLAGRSPPPGGGTALLREELSEAELRVVRYLPSNLTAPEIAAELCVSANTVRTHLRHIYAKLDAHSRGEAVARARDLGLLAPAPARAR